MDLTVEVLILGGGVTGTAIARDLALRGVRVCLLERGDLPAVTTGQVQGLLHSGARYVTHNTELARTCYAENQILRQIAAHCIDDTGGLFLLVDGRAELLFQRPFVTGCAAAGIPLEELNNAETVRLEPLVNPMVLRSFRVPDAVLDPWRLCVANVLAATEHDCWAFRGVTVDRLLRDGDQVVGATGRNSITGQFYAVRADWIINATGPWAGATAALAGVDLPLTFVKGTQLALAHRPVSHVITYGRPPATGDILVPDGSGMVLGGTLVPAHGLDDTAVPAHDQEHLLAEAQRLVPVLREVEQVRSWVALRPLLAQAVPAEEPDAYGRALPEESVIIDHAATDSVGGLVTVLGGLLTTARLTAERVSDLVCNRLGNTTACQTATIPLPGAAARQ